MLSTPKEQFTYSSVPYGSLSVATPPRMYTSDYQGLLVSEPHWRINPYEVVREIRGSRVKLNKRFARNSAWSGGGPFYVYKESLTHSGHVPAYRMRLGTTNIGPYSIIGVSPNIKSTKPVQPVPTSWSVMKDDVESYYATAYRKARPGNPVAGLGQFLAELRDLPKLPFSGSGAPRSRLWRSGGLWDNPFRGVPLGAVPGILYRRLGQFRNLGSEYLNVAFGWMPFVNDLRQMYNLQKTIDKRITQIIRENGRYVRRKATVSDDVTTSDVETLSSQPFLNVSGAPPIFMTGKTRHNVTTRTKTKIWFSGSFRYYIPDNFDSWQWTTRATAALFGALPTPELLWNVLPWSWLIDWFSNAGDVISNASDNAVDNLTCRYSFIMKHVTTTVTASSAVYAAGPTNPTDKWDSLDRTFISTKRVETKVRSGGGNPFGLNVKLPDLSAYQLGILAALGISRQKLL